MLLQRWYDSAMTIIHRTGDLFTTDRNILAHGVNIRGIMGAGIAPIFAREYPEMHTAYIEECKSGRLVPGTTFLWEDSNGDIILNVASQDNPGRNARITWLEDGLNDAINKLKARGEQDIVIALPRIGCGIGGLDWKDVEPLLAGIAAEHEITFEVWTL